MLSRTFVCEQSSRTPSEQGIHKQMGIVQASTEMCEVVPYGNLEWLEPTAKTSDPAKMRCTCSYKAHRFLSAFITSSQNKQIPCSETAMYNITYKHVLFGIWQDKDCQTVRQDKPVLSPTPHGHDHPSLIKMPAYYCPTTAKRRIRNTKRKGEWT